MKLDRVIAVRNNKTVFRDGKRCVKIFSDDFGKTRVFAEALNHTKIEEVADNVPSLLEVIRHNGNWAIVYDFIKGKTLAQWMEEEPEKLEEQILLLVNLQTEYHQMTCPSLGKMQDVLLKKILDAPLDPALRYALRSKMEKMPVSSKLCHGDLTPTNIIITEAGKVFVIDWPEATQGEPLADAAVTYLSFCVGGKQDAAKRYLSLYCEKMSVSEQEILDWLPIAAASRMACAKEKERDQLQAWIQIGKE